MISIEKKKNKIIESATKIFYEKGFSDTTISEIARGANLTSSGIYLYYKNKEELLFIIIEKFLIKSRDGLGEHLQGIHGAANKLRKAIWFHCNSYSGNKNEIKIVLEARSYPRFYDSSAYTILKQYTKFFTEIIQEGMADSSFYGLPSATLLRDVILGTVDHIAIHWILKNEPNSMEQSEKTYDMVMKAVQPQQTQETPQDKKSEKRIRIINSAIPIFANKGFNGTSMLEIARKANVAEGTVYEYFGNKENLLINIPNEKLNSLYDDISGNSPEMKIKNTISSIFEFYYNEKDYSNLLVLMLRTNKQFHKSKSSKILEKIFQTIEGEIIKGQASNIFTKDLDMNICRDFLFGTLDHIMIPMIIFDRKYDLKELGKQVSELFINVIRD